MSIVVGSIVELDEQRYVVADFFQQRVPGTRSTTVARLIRKNSNGTTTSFTMEPDGVDLIETPVFAPGERVKVDGFDGSIVETLAQEGVVNVLLDARTKALKGGDKLQLDPSISKQAFWRLVLENKL